MKGIRWFLPAALACAGLLLAGGIALADTSVEIASVLIPPSQETQPGVSNEACLACHGLPDQQITLPSGEILYLTVEQAVYDASSHGVAGYACVQCHTEIREYPHPPVDLQTRRQVTLRLNNTCDRCHVDKYQAENDSVHQQALTAGNQNAAVCTDCHGAHNVTNPAEPRTRIPETCERCHSEIYAIYAQSVHGSALIGEGNPDVPTCIDCHGVHNTEGPSSHTAFRLNSPKVCARCHTDEKLMEKYGLTTEVLNSYVSDFHGTSVVLFEPKAEGQETNKPVCIDCHGVHDITRTKDAESKVIQENLLGTCQRCHPDATANFSAAWLSHYRPSPEHYPVVYYVDLFYQFFIPVVLGGMALFVTTDIVRRLVNRRKEVVVHE